MGTIKNNKHTNYGPSVQITDKKRRTISLNRNQSDRNLEIIAQRGGEDEVDYHIKISESMNFASVVLTREEMLALFAGFIDAVEEVEKTFQQHRDTADE